MFESIYRRDFERAKAKVERLHKQIEDNEKMMVYMDTDSICAMRKDNGKLEWLKL